MLGGSPGQALVVHSGGLECMQINVFLLGEVRGDDELWNPTQLPKRTHLRSWQIASADDIGMVVICSHEDGATRTMKITDMNLPRTDKSRK